MGFTSCLAFLASLVLILGVSTLASAGEGRAVVEHVFEMADYEAHHQPSGSCAEDGEGV